MSDNLTVLECKSIVDLVYIPILVGLYTAIGSFSSGVSESSSGKCMPTNMRYIQAPIMAPICVAKTGTQNHI